MYFILFYFVLFVLFHFIVLVRDGFDAFVSRMVFFTLVVGLCLGLAKFLYSKRLFIRRLKSSLVEIRAHLRRG